MKLKNIAISLSCTLAGRQLELEIVPLRFAAPYFVRHQENKFPNTKGFHAFLGPFHLWQMSGLQDVFAVSISVQSNPFHGQSAYMPKP